MDLVHPHSGLTPAGGDAFIHRRILRKQPEQLSTDVTGGTDHRNAKTHYSRSVASQAFTAAS
jgi:hypothetical protein